MTPSGDAAGRERPPEEPRTLVLVWAAVIAGIGLASAFSAVLPRRWLDVAGAAAILFVLAPDLRLRRRGEDHQDDRGSDTTAGCFHDFANAAPEVGHVGRFSKHGPSEITGVSSTVSMPNTS